MENRLELLLPHRKGKIPIVLVHGTASSPGRWADLINELGASQHLRDNYEVWLFSYATSSYVPISAATLRTALTGTRAALDPRHEDPALDQIVVMGHSQGGLLTRMVASRSDVDKATELATNPKATLRSLRDGELTADQHDARLGFAEMGAEPALWRRRGGAFDRRDHFGEGRRGGDRRRSRVGKRLFARG